MQNVATLVTWTGDGDPRRLQVLQPEQKNRLLEEVELGFLSFCPRCRGQQQVSLGLLRPVQDHWSHWLLLDAHHCCQSQRPDVCC